MACSDPLVHEDDTVRVDLGDAHLTVVEFGDHELHVTTRFDVLGRHRCDCSNQCADARLEVAHPVHAYLRALESFET